MLENQNNNQEQNYRIFYCYSYKLNKFLKLLGYECIEESRNFNTHKKYWAFKNYDNEKMDCALRNWKSLRKEFNII